MPKILGVDDGSNTVGGRSSREERCCADARATAGAATGSVGNGSAAADGIIHECNVQGFQMVERLRQQHPQQCQDTQNAPPPVTVQPRTNLRGRGPQPRAVAWIQWE